jgi:4-amino-4-deoxychorismate lyase
MLPSRSLVNGIPTDLIDIRDRGLAYGDGLFETLPLLDGRPCLWAGHLARLQLGCQRLGIPFADFDLLAAELGQLAGAESGVGKVIITRGSSARGYAAPADLRPNRLIRFSPGWSPPASIDAIPRIQARLCQTRLSINPQLAGIKHLNRLEQVLARQEWTDSQIAEGLLCDAEGFVVEGVASNLFIREGERLLTPLLDRCGVAGVMRAAVITTALELGIEVVEARFGPEHLLAADAAFVCNSVTGVRLISQIDQHRYTPSWGKPIWQALLQALINKMIEP